ncbi:MAG TPA: hypothetical protein VHL31_23830 [Geminicoccus sp.]|uniref:hypothetical protein n=1 Tax=Geminicoccus sp. TaxID=2024832 RepID=UPI002E37D6D2|nr:hypothetical protein [Geminicoccus sp.]HEX2529309.1 hypothetical protein [Geminicoccus sp.]
MIDHLPSYQHLVAQSGDDQLACLRQALANLAQMLNANATACQLRPALIARTHAGLAQALCLLKEGHYLRKAMSLVATHRENGRDIEIRYDGIAPTISAENEEAWAAAGLQRLSIGIHPDHAATRTRAGHASISLDLNGQALAAIGEKATGGRMPAPMCPLAPCGRPGQFPDGSTLGATF